MSHAITTARLSQDSQNKLFTLSRLKRKTKSDIIKESLDLYYDLETKEMDSFMVGEPYFGNYGSGDGDRSTTYKRRIKEKLRGKLNSN